MASDLDRNCSQLETGIQPTIGWICTHPTLLGLDRGMADEEGPGQWNEANQYHIFRIGSITVVSSNLQMTCCSELMDTMQNIRMKFPTIQAYLLGGLDVISPKLMASAGDIIIQTLVTNSMSTAENVGLRTIHVLEHEIGNDGKWLLAKEHMHQRDIKYPMLRYTKMPTEAREVSQAGSAYLTSHLTALDISSLTLPIIYITGVVGEYGASEMEHHMSAAANVINYSKELVLAMGSTLVRNIAEIAGTERVVPPITKTLPTQPFSLFQYSVSGNSVVVIIPTENEFKIQLLEGTFRNQNVSVRTITVPVESGVGEQPYNDAGVVGAYNRINNALKRLNTEEYREILLKNGAGTVFVASVENFIQTTNIERPTDYGIIVIHNATNNKTTLGISCGVTVPPEYVSRARHFGFGEELDHGRVTVGQILAANVAGLDKRDWHKVLARKSRYELLRETTGLLPIPW